MLLWPSSSQGTKSFFSSLSSISKPVFLAVMSSAYVCDTVRYKCNIQLAGGIIKYVPLTPPPRGAIEKSSSAEWVVDFEKFAQAITPKTKMIVSLERSSRGRESARLSF